MNKEQELNRLMIEYYSFDMQSLKDEVDRILNHESDKITKEKEDKLKQIQNNLKRIMTLAQDHIAKGSNYRVGESNEQQVLDEFERQSEEFEKIVKEANLNKN